VYLFHIFRSFVPLRNPLGFGVSDLLALGVALLALIAIFGHAWAGDWFASAARRTAWCMIALFVLPIALRLALLPRVPPPVPATSDEFSSLTLADTLLHGRLANPSHPFPEFFEAPLVVQKPAYRSTLPLADGLLPAAGRLLFRSDWAGILLGTGALSALSYWMLRAWVTPGWALCGGVLVACAFGPLGRWTNSYWGGFISAVAGCIILGVLPRLRQNYRLRNAAFWRNALFLTAALTIELLANPAAFCLFLPIFVLAAVLGLNGLQQFRPALLFIVLLMYGVHFLFWYGLHAFADAPELSALTLYEGRDFLNSGEAQARRALMQELNREPGKQLVFVRRGPWHTSGEWIHNSADIDASKVVWARDLGEEDDQKLLEYYRGRKAWLLEPDAIPPRLRRYGSGSGPFEIVR